MNKNQAAPFQIPQSIVGKYNDEVIDFLKMCLKKDYNERMSADKLLKHTFLCNHNADTMAMRPVENMKDLEFMTNSLIKYYSLFDCTSLDSKVTPIDSVHSDEERLQNIAKSSGYSI